ncbi:MAG: zinc ribbon domain-containing protein [Anaerolineales bacterium]
MNMMKYCPECYKELPPNSPTCPYCGYKTGNGDDGDHPTPGFLKTPETDSYLPPEQTFLSLLLLAILFWAINISLTVFPIFINFGTTRNILIAFISAQVLTRIIIGIWAVEEQSLKKDVTTNQMIGAFFLALVPVGGIMSFLQAARSSIRKDRLSNLFIASISAVIIMSILLYGTKEGISALSTGESISSTPEATQDPAVAALYEDEDEIEVEEPTSIPPTPTQRSYVDGCRNPNSIGPEEEGDIVDVCGRVTNFGEIECESCPLGYYSFIKLDRGFQIISYDWIFSFAWLGDCMAVSDVVELLGEEPVFVFGKGEGYSGTECTTDLKGELVCDGGFYFQDYFGCDDRQLPNK